MINITSKQSSIRMIRSNDKKWFINDGFTVAPRAGFEICGTMPREYKLIITECMNKGWFRPIANVKDNELFWEALRDE
jgi:hypothetical protein